MMSAEPELSIIIRDIEAGAEMHAVEELQKKVWRVPDLDVVPLSQLVAAKTAGGVLLGAFDRANLVGFVYGFVEYEHGQVGHHSHMLAVKPGFHNFHLGQRLKLAQRERVLSQGINVMTWTFDPLQRLNAHINFTKLGVVSNRYLVNFYGADATSFLHRNGTDRLWVTWLLTSRRVNERLDKTFVAPEFGKAKPLVELGEGNVPRRYDLDHGLSNGQVFIEIPPDISDLERQDMELAAEWREATRMAFTEAITAGFLIEDFYRQGKRETHCGVYLLSPQKGLEDIE